MFSIGFNLPLFFELLENLALLTLVGLGVYVIDGNTKAGSLRAQLWHGALFGMAAFLVTATPITMLDGATVDTRAGPVMVAAIIGGPLSAVIAAGFGALCRGLVGGDFAVAGMVAYFIYAAFGMALGRLGLITRATLATPLAVVLLVLCSFAGAAAVALLIEPPALARAWLRDDLPLILAANLISILYTVLVVGIAAHLLRKTAEGEVLRERLDLAKRAGGFGIWDFDIATGQLHWDARSAELHGLTPKSMVCRYEDWAKTIDPEDLTRLEENFHTALEDRDDHHVEYRVPLEDGEARVIRGDALIMRDASGAPVRAIGTNLDLTPLRRTEAELTEARSIATRAQKFETVGKMTGGLAHDFNNILAIVMGNQDLLREALKTPEHDPALVEELIGASEQAIKRGADLTRNLLAYARQAQLRPEALDLNAVVRETEAWLRRTIESHIEIGCDLQGGLWPVQVDRASLQSAVVNLLINARDALEGPGTVTIATANVTLGPGDPATGEAGLPSGAYVQLSVSDTGPGIPPEMMQEIFDPFFTTKPVGQGTGLGLSMVQGFVTQSGGAIRVTCPEAGGARFTLYFPAAHPQAAAPRHEDKEEAPPVARAGERILVVEDEPELLTVITRTLGAAGYDVVACQSADAAFELFGEDRDFALVATDMVMPGTLQGPALAKAVRALVPGMPFLFFSGYAPEADGGQMALGQGDTRLLKPFPKRDLLAAVRAAIGDAARSARSGQEGPPPSSKAPWPC
jgi:signal transduction histidine kinase/CheY-like chemotaxis protein